MRTHEWRYVRPAPPHLMACTALWVEEKLPLLLNTSSLPSMSTVREESWSAISFPTSRFSAGYGYTQTHRLTDGSRHAHTKDK